MFDEYVIVAKTDAYPDECQWEGPFKGYYISGGTLVTLKDHNQDMCKEACEAETTFHCHSFDYIHSSYTCYLKTYSRYGHALSASASYEYYERNCYGLSISVILAFDIVF